MRSGVRAAPAPNPDRYPTIPQHTITHPLHPDAVRGYNGHGGQET